MRWSALYGFEERPATGGDSVEPPPVFASAGQAHLHEAVPRDSAETGIARSKRLDEELNVEPVPRLREQLVGHQRERDPAITGCLGGLTLDDARSPAHEHRCAAHGPPATGSDAYANRDRLSAARHRVWREDNGCYDEAIASCLQVANGKGPGRWWRRLIGTDDSGRVRDRRG